MNLSELFILQFVMFAEIAAGYALCRFHILKSQDRAVLSKLVINLLLPCSIINSFQIVLSREVIIKFAQIFFVSVGIQVFCALIARYAYRSLPEKERPIFQYATVCSNAGFLGNAVAEGVYGAEGLLYGQIYLIPQRVVMWSAGVAYFASRKADRKKTIISILTHPCIVALGIGLVRMIFQIPVPAAVNSLLAGLGRCSTPLVMLFLGMILSEAGIKEMFSKKNLLFAVIRLVVIPAVVLGACVLLKMDPLITGLSVLLAAMPAGSTTAVLAEQYHADSSLAADCVVLTTLLSIALLPVWVHVLQMVR